MCIEPKPSRLDWKGLGPYLVLQLLAMDCFVQLPAASVASMTSMHASWSVGQVAISLLPVFARRLMSMHSCTLLTLQDLSGSGGAISW